MEKNNKPSREEVKAGALIANFRFSGTYELIDTSRIKPARPRVVGPNDIDSFAAFDGKIQTFAESERQRRDRNNPKPQE